MIDYILYYLYITMQEPTSLDLSIPENIHTYPEELQTSIKNYLSSLDSLQKKAYIIAKQHLGTSFDIVRSTGYTEWNKTKR